MPRLFVGIDFPEDLKLTLAALCAGEPGVQWVASANFHLTLCFIGEVDDGMADRITAALGLVEADRFPLCLAGVGHFRGHTLWVGVEPSPALMDLQAAVRDALARLGLPPDHRPYAPHVKLARSRRRRGFRAYLDRHAGFRPPPFEVTQFSLIESRLSPLGAAYAHRADYPLMAVETAAAESA